MSERERKLSSISFYMDNKPIGSGTHLVISFNINYSLIIILGIRVSTYEFWGDIYIQSVVHE
jgi:hypothetical protein